MKKGTCITSNPPKTVSANSTSIRIVLLIKKKKSIRIVKTIRTFETDCNQSERAAYTPKGESGCNIKIFINKDIKAPFVSM